METITITVRLDDAYRKRAESALGVDFTDYLTGVVINHLMKNGGFDKDVRGVKKGKMSAILRSKGHESIGRTMRLMAEEPERNYTQTGRYNGQTGPEAHR